MLTTLSARLSLQHLTITAAQNKALSQMQSTKLNSTQLEIAAELSFTQTIAISTVKLRRKLPNDTAIIKSCGFSATTELLVVFSLHVISTANRRC